MIQANGFNRALAVYAAFATIVHETDAAITAAVTGCSVSAATAISKTAHGFTVGQRIIRHDTGTGWSAIPAGIPLFVVAAATDTFGVALTQGGAAISDTGTDGAFHVAEVFFAEPLNNDSKAPEFAQINRRGMNGLEGLAAQQIKSTTSEWSWTVDEDLRLLTLFGGYDVGQSLGYNTIYIRDAADASSKVRKKSERFYGAITPAQNSNYGGGDFSKPRLKLSATKPDGSQVSWLTNVTLTA